MTRTKKEEEVKDNLKDFRDYVVSEVKRNKVMPLFELQSACEESEVYRLIMSYFAKSKRLTYYPSGKTARQGLSNYLKSIKDFHIYNKPVQVVSYGRISK